MKLNWVASAIKQGLEAGWRDSSQNLAEPDNIDIVSTIYDQALSNKNQDSSNKNHEPRNKNHVICTVFYAWSSKRYVPWFMNQDSW